MNTIKSTNYIICETRTVMCKLNENEYHYLLLILVDVHRVESDAFCL